MFVNVPIGIAAAALSQKLLQDGGGRMANRRLDLPGALTVTSGLILLVYGLTNASNEGFSSLQAIIPLGLSLLALAGFVAVESRSKFPLVPLGFLRRGTVLSANVLALIFTSASGGLGFILTIYMQQILGYSALQAGLGFLPPAIIFFVVGGWGSSWFVDRLGIRRVLVAATALITVGFALLTQISAQGDYLGIAPGMSLWALGASIGFPALNIAALAGTRPGEEGLASGLISTSQRVGFPLGLAVLLTIATAFDPVPIGAAGPAASADGVVAGFRYALVAAALLGVLGFIIALRIKQPKAPKGPS